MKNVSQKILNLKSFKAFKSADLLFDPIHNLGVITTKRNFLPLAEFKNIFMAVEDMIKENSIKKIVFDKRTLTIFNQASMEWYYLNWKPAIMNKYGLKDHYKILPQDDFFKTSVHIGRNKLLSTNKDHKIQEINIKYIESLEEAINN